MAKGDEELEAALAAIESMSVGPIDARIEAIDAEMAAVMSPLVKKREALVVLRKIVEVREHGKPRRKSPKPRAARGDSNGATSTAAPASGLNIQERMIAFLQANGPSKVAHLADGCQASPAAVYANLQRSALFVRNDSTNIVSLKK